MNVNCTKDGKVLQHPLCISYGSQGGEATELVILGWELVHQDIPSAVDQHASMPPKDGGGGVFGVTTATIDVTINSSATWYD